MGRALALFKLRHLHGEEQPCSPSPLKLSRAFLRVPHHQTSTASSGRLIQSAVVLTIEKCSSKHNPFFPLSLIPLRVIFLALIVPRLLRWSNDVWLQKGLKAHLLSLMTARIRIARCRRREGAPHGKMNKCDHCMA